MFIFQIHPNLQYFSLFKSIQPYKIVHFSNPSNPTKLSIFQDHSEIQYCLFLNPSQPTVLSIFQINTTLQYYLFYKSIETYNIFHFRNSSKNTIFNIFQIHSNLHFLYFFSNPSSQYYLFFKSIQPTYFIFQIHPNLHFLFFKSIQTYNCLFNCSFRPKTFFIPNNSDYLTKPTLKRKINFPPKNYFHQFNVIDNFSYIFFILKFFY